MNRNSMTDDILNPAQPTESSPVSRMAGASFQLRHSMAIVRFAFSAKAAKAKFGWPQANGTVVERQSN